MKSVAKIHKSGFVHTDIKLDNIMVTFNHEVVLIDYGQAQQYKSDIGVHRPNKPVTHDYNPYFCSINVLRKQTLSRRDDFIQIVYNLMCLSNEF